MSLVPLVPATRKPFHPGLSVRINLKPLPVLLGLVLFACSACRRQPQSDVPIGPAVAIQVPLGLPPLSYPSDNPPTAEGIALGRKLFYDTRLSVDHTLSCASCHDPHAAFTDGLRLSKGVGGALGIRNAPSVLNAAYLPFQFWDGRAASLEQQAISPIEDPVEMSQPHKFSVAKLGLDPAYKPMFAKTFGSPDITIDRIEKALASFERTLLSGNSPFDRYAFAGATSALTPAQVRGLATFKDPTRGNCTACHTISKDYALFTDGKFHNIGEGVGDDGEFLDTGRYHETRLETDRGAFMTPGLRNVALTAPYMHDGRLKTLKEVVDFYAGGGNSNPNLDKEIRAIKLSPQDREDLVAFLEALTGDLPSNSGPPSVAPPPTNLSRNSLP